MPFLLVAVVKAQATETTVQPTTLAPTATGWTGCVDPINGPQLVTIGQKTTVCLVLANSVDWSTEMQYMRLNFQPTADEYSRFLVPQSYSQLTGNALQRVFPGNVTVHTESQTAYVLYIICY